MLHRYSLNAAAFSLEFITTNTISSTITDHGKKSGNYKQRTILE
jgi:hypothetical protein